MVISRSIFGAGLRYHPWHTGWQTGGCRSVAAVPHGKLAYMLHAQRGTGTPHGVA